MVSRLYAMIALLGVACLRTQVMAAAETEVGRGGGGPNPTLLAETQVEELRQKHAEHAALFSISSFVWLTRNESEDMQVALAYHHGGTRVGHCLVDVPAGSNCYIMAGTDSLGLLVAEGSQAAIAFPEYEVDLDAGGWVNYHMPPRTGSHVTEADGRVRVTWTYSMAQMMNEDHVVVEGEPSRIDGVIELLITTEKTRTREVQDAQGGREESSNRGQ